MKFEIGMNQMKFENKSSLEFDKLLIKKNTINRVCKLIELEIKLYKRQDMILSEREILEDKKIVSVLESLLTKIEDQ
jgi:hypothetical protein